MKCGWNGVMVGGLEAGADPAALSLSQSGERMFQ